MSELAMWIASVAEGRATMSQRGERWVTRNGGLEAVVAAARAQAVHLVQLTDDQGRRLVAASREPFTTLC